MSPTTDLTTTARDGAQTVLQSAGEQANALTHQAGDQVRDIVTEAKSQVREVSVRERDRLTQAMGEFNDELRQMTAAGSGGYATQAAQQVLAHSQEWRERLAVLDPTKLVPEELAPIVAVGTMTLDRNPVCTRVKAFSQLSRWQGRSVGSSRPLRHTAPGHGWESRDEGGRRRARR